MHTSPLRHREEGPLTVEDQLRDLLGQADPLHTTVYETGIVTDPELTFNNINILKDMAWRAITELHGMDPEHQKYLESLRSTGIRDYGCDASPEGDVDQQGIYTQVRNLIEERIRIIADTAATSQEQEEQLINLVSTLEGCHYHMELRQAIATLAETLSEKEDPGVGEWATETLLNTLRLKPSEATKTAVDPRMLHYNEAGKLVTHYPIVRDEQGQITPEAPLNQLYSHVTTIVGDPQAAPSEIEHLISVLEETHNEFKVRSEEEIMNCLSDTPDSWKGV